MSYDTAYRQTTGSQKPLISSFMDKAWNSECLVRDCFSKGPDRRKSFSKISAINSVTRTPKHSFGSQIYSHRFWNLIRSTKEEAEGTPVPRNTRLPRDNELSGTIFNLRPTSPPRSVPHSRLHFRVLTETHLLEPPLDSFPQIHRPRPPRNSRRSLERNPQEGRGQAKRISDVLMIWRRLEISRPAR